MAATRHNLTRRALPGAGVGACAQGHVLVRVPPVQGADSTGAVAGGERGHVQVHVPWRRTLAAYRRAEARVAAFKAAERALPPARRAWPACEDLEDRFGDLARRLAVLRRLLRTPAPDLPALALKPVLSEVEGLDLDLADLAWELAGSETCLETLAADARRLAANASG